MTTDLVLRDQKTMLYQFNQNRLINKIFDIFGESPTIPPPPKGPLFHYIENLTSDLVWETKKPYSTKFHQNRLIQQKKI